MDRVPGAIRSPSQSQSRGTVPRRMIVPVTPQTKTMPSAMAM
jgi:hypothetical protein